MNELLAEIESDLIFKQQLNLAEHNIYGSSRLGVKQDTSRMHFSRFTASSIDTITGNIVKDSILYQMEGVADSLNSQRVLGYKQYELSNQCYLLTFEVDTLPLEGLKPGVTTAYWYNWSKDSTSTPYIDPATGETVYYIIAYPSTNDTVIRKKL